VVRLVHLPRFIRGGSAGAALSTFRQPGIYAYVTHNLIEAVELGATAHFKVEGTWDDDLMKQVRPPEPIPEARQGAPGAPSHALRLTVIVSLELKLAAASLAVLLPAWFMVQPRSDGADGRVAIPDLIELRPGSFSHRAAGDFSRSGRSASAPIVTVRIDHPFPS
jgi:hypothetical protein